MEKSIRRASHYPGRRLAQRIERSRDSALLLSIRFLAVPEITLGAVGIFLDLRVPRHFDFAQCIDSLGMIQHCHGERSRTRTWFTTSACGLLVMTLCRFPPCLRAPVVSFTVAFLRELRGSARANAVALNPPCLWVSLWGCISQGPPLPLLSAGEGPGGEGTISHKKNS